MATDLQNGTDTSVTGLVKGIIDDVHHLTTQQFALLRQEVKEDMTRTGHASLPMMIGVGILFIATLLLGVTLTELLRCAIPQLPSWVAYAIVTAVLTGTGLALFLVGLKKFQAFNPLPDRSLEALQENVECLTNPKEHLTNPK
jgi:hypothetical protein